MMRTTHKAGIWMAALISLTFLAGCRSTAGDNAPSGKVVLWNGENFAAWERIVADPNVDVNTVWTIRDGVLCCTGKPNGYIRTRDRYHNYHLHVEWRWPETPTNSGVLLHMSGRDTVWPPCIECQLKSGSAGDIVLMNGTGIAIDGVSQKNPAKQFVVVAKNSPTSELPVGQWNSYDIYCQGASIRCLVNGVLQNEGADASVTAGWIGLQSEGGPIEFRNVYLEAADSK